MHLCISQYSLTLFERSRCKLPTRSKPPWQDHWTRVGLSLFHLQFCNWQTLSKAVRIQAALTLRSGQFAAVPSTLGNRYRIICDRAPCDLIS
mmetsp:Transcript_45314/g.72741  ORF Transcript_45314/g.72741 Transcript_45314/m.72741 type:complete len:92 (+) Transcript_45314:240-515(+)